MEKLLEGGTEHRMDLGCVTWNADGKAQKRYFLVSCGIGYDAAVCQEALDSPMKDALNKLGLGKLTYLGIGLKQMLTLQYRFAWTAGRSSKQESFYLRRE